MGREIYKILTLIFCCAIAGCVKDKPAEYNISPTSTGNVYIVCEGNFGNGNASLYSINAAHDSAYGDLYKAANNQSLGDVFQSMRKIDDQLFLCINNSDKVIVVNATNLKTTGTINIPKPRYILPVSSTKAYVSSLYNNKVYVINPQTRSLTDSIILPYLNTEGMCLYNGMAIICTWDTAGNKVYKVDLSTNELIQTIQVGGYAPQSALVDKEQMLWVLSGNKTKGRSAAWTRIDPSTGQILVTYNFPSSVDPLRPVFNNTKDTIYFIEVDYSGSTANNGIYRMGIHDAALPQQPFIAAAQNQYFWGLGVEPATGNIYIGDPKGFIQKGIVYIYKPDGSPVASFNVGVGPGSFYFGE